MGNGLAREYPSVGCPDPRSASPNETVAHSVHHTETIEGQRSHIVESARLELLDEVVKEGAEVGGSQCVVVILVMNNILPFPFQQGATARQDSFHAPEGGGSSGIAFATPMISPPSLAEQRSRVLDNAGNSSMELRSHSNLGHIPGGSRPHTLQWLSAAPRQVDSSTSDTANTGTEGRARPRELSSITGGSSLGRPPGSGLTPLLWFGSGNKGTEPAQNSHFQPARNNGSENEMSIDGSESTGTRSPPESPRSPSRTQSGRRRLALPVQSAAHSLSPGTPPTSQQRPPGTPPTSQQRPPGTPPTSQQRPPGIPPTSQQRPPGIPPTPQQRPFSRDHPASSGPSHGNRRQHSQPQDRLLTDLGESVNKMNINLEALNSNLSVLNDFVKSSRTPRNKQASGSASTRPDGDDSADADTDEPEVKEYRPPKRKTKMQNKLHIRSLPSCIVGNADHSAEAGP